MNVKEKDLEKDKIVNTNENSNLIPASSKEFVPIKDIDKKSNFSIFKILLIILDIIFILIILILELRKQPLSEPLKILMRKP